MEAVIFVVAVLAAGGDIILENVCATPTSRTFRGSEVVRCCLTKPDEIARRLVSECQGGVYQKCNSWQFRHCAVQGRIGLSARQEQWGSPMKRFFSLLGFRRWKDVKQSEKDVYDNWASTYDHSFWPIWLDRWADAFARDVPEESSIIDIGCGTGNALLRLSRRNPSLLAGIDISPESIVVAKAKLSSLPVDLRAGDAESNLPWPEDTFDVAVMNATIHHFPKPEAVLHQAFRILKPQGRLIIADPLFFFPFLQIANLCLRVYPLNGDLRFFSQRGLRQLIERCGFQDVEQKHAAFLARYTMGFKP